MTDRPGTTATRRIYTGSVINLDEDDVLFPDASTGTLAVVRHPGASAVVPILSDTEGSDPTLLLIRQFRHAAGESLLEIPAGRLDAGEDPEACARRELREETGCTAETMTPLITMLTTPGFSDERIHLFVASGLTRGEARHEADEFIEPVAMQLTEALARIEKGEIRDAKTVLGILYVAGFVLRR